MKKIKSNIIYLGLIYFSLVTSFLIFIDNEKPDYYMLLPIVPFSFALILVIFKNISKYILKNIAPTLIVFLYFVKLAFVPFLLFIGGYASIGINYYVYSNVDKAILLIVYEFFLVVFVLTFFCEKYYINLYSKTSFYSNDYDLSITFRGKCAIFTVMMVFLLIIVKSPNLIDYFKFLKVDGEESINRGNVLGSVFAIFVYITNILFFLIPFIIFNKLLKIKNKNVSWMLCLILSLSPLTISLPDHWYSIACSFVMIVTIINVFPKNRKLNLLLGGMLIILATIMLLKKIGGISEGSSLKEVFGQVSIIISAYFPSVENVACSFIMPISGKIQLFVGDILRSIPFVAGIFKSMPISPNLFNETYFGYCRSDQIFNFIGQSYFYFGFILAPIIVLIITWFTVKLSMKYSNEQNLLVKMIYLWLVFYSAFMFIAGNMNGYISGIFQFIIPFHIISNIIKKKDVKTGKTQ